MENFITKTILGMSIAAMVLTGTGSVNVYAKDNSELKALEKKWAALQEDAGWRYEDIVGCEFTPDAAFKKKYDNITSDISFDPDFHYYYDAKLDKGMTEKQFKDSFFDYYRNDSVAGAGFSIFGDHNYNDFYVHTPDNKFVKILVSPMSMHMEKPDHYVADYDGDGKDELIIQPKVLHGTGYMEDTLIMIDTDKSGSWYAYHFNAKLYEDYFNKVASTTVSNKKATLKYRNKALGDPIPVKTSDAKFRFDSLVGIYPIQKEIYVYTNPFVPTEGNMDGIGEFSQYRIWLNVKYKGAGQFTVTDSFSQLNPDKYYEKAVEKLKEGLFYGYIEGPAVETPILVTTEHVVEEITSWDPDSLYDGHASLDCKFYLLNGTSSLRMVEKWTTTSAYMPLAFTAKGVLYSNRFSNTVYDVNGSKFVPIAGIDRGTDDKLVYTKSTDGKTYTKCTESEYGKLLDEYGTAHSVVVQKKMKY